MDCAHRVEYLTEPEQVRRIAESAVAMIAPVEWFDDEHGSRHRPRCCQAVGCLTTTLLEVGEWDDLALRELTMAIADGIAAL